MKFSSVTAAGAAFGLAAATPMPSKRSTTFSSLAKRQVPQEQSHGFILASCNEFMKLENTLNIQDCVFGLLGNAAAEEGAGDVTDLDCLKQESADQAFTNAKAIEDVEGMAGALLFMAIERNTGSVGLKSVLCEQPARNAEIGALSQHQDAAAEDAPELNKAITLELARQLASIGADPNLALLSGTFAPGDVNDNTGAGNTCDTEDPALGCIYTEGLLVLDATEEEIAEAVADVEQTFTGTGGIQATDLVNLADFTVAEVTGEPFDLAQVTPGSGAAAEDDAAAVETPTPGAEETTTATEVADELTDVVTSTASPATATAINGQCSLVQATIGADQTKAILAQYPTAVVGKAAAASVTSAASSQTTEAAQTTEEAAQATEEAAAGNNANDECQNGNGNAQNDNAQEDAQDDAEDNADDAAAGDATQEANGNLQAFAGNIGGAPPPVTNSGNADRPFEVNGAAFDNEASALIRSCDIQNNQCFNAINGGELDEDTSVCQQQLNECQAAAGNARRRRSFKARRNAVLVGAPSAARPIAGGKQVLGGGVNGVAGLLGQNQNVAIGGLLGGQGIITGGNIALINQLDLATLLGGAQAVNLGNILAGGNIGGLIGGGNFVLAPSVGQQQQFVVELIQCS